MVHTMSIRACNQEPQCEYAGLTHYLETIKWDVEEHSMGDKPIHAKVYICKGCGTLHYKLERREHIKTGVNDDIFRCDNPSNLK